MLFSFSYFLVLTPQGKLLLIPPCGNILIPPFIPGKIFQDIQIQIQNIKTKAIAEHNDAVLARCLADLLMIQRPEKQKIHFFFQECCIYGQYTQQFFKFATFEIDHPQLFLARRISLFENNIYYRLNKNLIRTGIPGKEYALMGRLQLDSLIAEHIDSSIAISKTTYSNKRE